MKRSPIFSSLAGMTLAVGLAMFTAAPSSGQGEEEEGTNNLSVPTIFVDHTFGTPTCDEDPEVDDTVLPVGEPSTEFPGYWIQGVDFWQADCMLADEGTVDVTADWGDNLITRPRLTAGRPIRVEIGLLANPSAYPMTGFTVEKLTDEVDRLATYGTDDGSGITPYPEVRVWDHDATLSIVDNDDPTNTVFTGTFSAEINSTGRVVYGYNWQNAAVGTYTITVNTPGVTITGVTDDKSDVSEDRHTVTLEVTVGSGGGGGGGGGGGNPPGGGGPPDDRPGGPRR